MLITIISVIAETISCVLIIAAKMLKRTDLMDLVWQFHGS